MGWTSTGNLAMVAAVTLACGETANGPLPVFDCTVPTEEFFDGQVGRNGIPALTNPEVVSPDAPIVGQFLAEEDRVYGMVINGVPRAYPQRIMWWHEIVNDTLGDEHILFSYCPLTGTPISFDPHVDGKLRTFGGSGLLRENNLTMFDNETESLWNQIALGALCGPDRGNALDRLPNVATTWRLWKSLYPNTTVMTTNTGFTDRPYQFYPYGTYDEPNNRIFTFPPSPFSDLRPPKELVLGVHRGADATAYAFGILTGKGSFVVLNEAVADVPLLVTFVTAEQTAMAFDRRIDGDTLTFTLLDEDERTFRDEETGSTWNVKGEATAGPLTGRSLPLYEDAFVSFWFAWSIRFPGTRLFL